MVKFNGIKSPGGGPENGSAAMVRKDRLRALVKVAAVVYSRLRNNQTTPLRVAGGGSLGSAEDGEKVMAIYEAG